MGLKVGNLVTPSPEQWYVAIKGMRHAYKSTDKSDSFISELYPDCFENCSRCDLNNKKPEFIIGKEDKKLLLNLCKSGTSHRKVLRQLPVIMDIKAPLYWWKEMDQYKTGTCTNSESTMHTLTKKEFELEDFSIKQEYLKSESGWLAIDTYNFPENLVTLLNNLRGRYLDTKNIEYWNKINELLPQSYLQTRTWSANYEVLVNIIVQRKGHKLKEWNELIKYWLENIPYLKEIVEAIDERKGAK